MLFLGYVSFERPEHARKAADDMDGHDIDGLVLAVRVKP